MSDKEELKFHYFVSYSHKYGHGNMRISRPEKITSMGCIVGMQDLIAEDFGVTAPIILNYIQLDSK